MFGDAPSTWPNKLLMFASDSSASVKESWNYTQIKNETIHLYQQYIWCNKLKYLSNATIQNIVKLKVEIKRMAHSPETHEQCDQSQGQQLRLMAL